MMGRNCHAWPYLICHHSNKSLVLMHMIRRSFGSMLVIIPLADTVTKSTARCELCSKRAFFTLRKTKETQTGLIGGADVYMPVSAALCQRTSSQGSCKDCPGISKRSVCLLCIVQLRKTVETKIELIGLSTCLCVDSTMSTDK